MPLVPDADEAQHAPRPDDDTQAAPPAPHAAHAEPHEGDLWLSYMDRSSRERLDQSAAFERSLLSLAARFDGAIGDLRRDFRTFGIVMLAGILALAGINVVLNAGVFQFSAVAVGSK